jgi:hypothetical protein
MTQLTDEQLAKVLKDAVPEPRDRFESPQSARRLALRMRRRRRILASCVAVAAAVAVAVPTAVLSSGNGRETARPAATPTPGGGSVATPSTGCGTSCDPATVRAALERPLQLPSLAPGQSCPVSPTSTFPGGAGFSGEFDALGSGPLFLQPGDPSKPVTLRFDSKSWASQKVIWVVARDYAGPLLLRGRRIDAPGKLGFAHYLGAVGYPGSGPGDDKAHRDLLYVRQGLGARGPRVLDSFPSGVYAQSPGCYAIQVDGESFTEMIIFRARIGVSY